MDMKDKSDRVSDLPFIVPYRGLEMRSQSDYPQSQYKYCINITVKDHAITLWNMLQRMELQLPLVTSNILQI